MRPRPRSPPRPPMAARPRTVPGRTPGRSPTSSRARRSASRPPRLRRIQPPRRRHEIRVERAEAARFAEPRGCPVLGDPPGDLRELDLVREDRRRDALGRLPGVEGGEDEVADARAASEPTPGDRRSVSCAVCWLTRSGHVSERGAQRTRGRRSGSRPQPTRRRRRAPPASPTARTGSLRAPRRSGAGRSSRSASSTVPRTCTPWMRRRRSLVLSSRKPTTRVSGVSASSRASALPERPAPTTRTRRCSPRTVPPQRQQPECEARGGHERRAEERVDQEDLEGEVAERAEGRRRSPS